MRAFFDVIMKVTHKSKQPVHIKVSNKRN